MMIDLIFLTAISKWVTPIQVNKVLISWSKEDLQEHN